MQLDNNRSGFDSKSPTMVERKDSVALQPTKNSLIVYIILIVAVPVLAVLLQMIVSGREEKTNVPATRSSSSFLHRRRLQHILTGLMFYGISFLLSQFVGAVLLALATSLFYGLHKSRSFSKSVQDYYMKHFGPLLRDHEKKLDTLPGAFWFLLGSLFVFSSFTMSIARASLLSLTFGDPIAAMVGIRFGGDGIYGNKTAVGCLACFVTCVFTTFCCMSHFDVDVWVLGGVVSTAMETFSLGCAIDDNFLIPVGTGIVLWLYTNNPNI